MTHSSRKGLAGEAPITRRRKTSSFATKREEPLGSVGAGLDRLLSIATTPWADDSQPDVIVRTVLEVLGESMPDQAWAVSIAQTHRESRRPPTVRAWRRLPEAPVEPAVPSDRFFPEFAREQSIDVERQPFRYSVTLGTDLLLDPESEKPGLLLLERAGTVLAATLHALRKSREITAECAALRAQVIQSEKLATIGELAAGLVHELNNPLTSILGYAEYLRSKAESKSGDPTDIERLHRICEAATRMLRFSRDLIGYARPSRPSRLPMSVHEIIDQAHAFCEHAFKEGQITFNRHYALNIPPVLAAGDQLIQVFVNLLTNACHAISNGGKVEVRTDLDPDANAVRITVSDDGSGIDEAILPRLFEPFFTTKAEGRGSGLGLSIVQRIVLSHGGTIDVSSRVNAGTTVRIVLPAVESSFASDEEQTVGQPVCSPHLTEAAVPSSRIRHWRLPDRDP